MQRHVLTDVAILNLAKTCCNKCQLAFTENKQFEEEADSKRCKLRTLLTGQCFLCALKHPRKIQYESLRFFQLQMTAQQFLIHLCEDDTVHTIRTRA